MELRTVYIHPDHAFYSMGFSTLAYWKSKIFVKIFDNYIPKDENEENGEEKNEPKEA